MSLRYWDIVFQTVDRLKLVLGQFATVEPAAGWGKVEVIPMRNFQKDIEDFMKGAGGEKARLMVTHSGIQVEGGRKVTDFIMSLGRTDQRIGHGIEVHICTKQLMKLTDGDKNEMTSLGLEWVVSESLRGLHIYARKSDGTVDLDNEMSIKSTGGMFHIETLPDREYDGALFSTVRFQVEEVVLQMANMSPEQILGVYRDIILNEYSTPIGGTPPSTPNEIDTVDSTTQ